MNVSKYYNIDNKLTEREKEIAYTLLKGGWYGTIDELIDCVQKLSKEDK